VKVKTMLSSFRWSLGCIAVFPAFMLLNCGDHDPDVQREGGALPHFDGGGGADGTVTFCEALAVVQKKCQRCHTDPTENGAPFPLLTYEDFQEPYPHSDSPPVWERAGKAVESGFMPAVSIPIEPPPEPLTKAEKTTLLSWFNQGAPKLGGTDCPSAGGGGESGVGEGGSSTAGGAGGSGEDPEPAGGAGGSAGSD
jgi:hypothetical protein